MYARVPLASQRRGGWIAASALPPRKDARFLSLRGVYDEAIQPGKVGKTSGLPRRLRSSQRRSELVIAKPVGLRQSSRFLSAAPPRKDARFLSLRGVYDEAYMDAHICQAFNS